jgi:hypothetical protein
MSRLLSEVQAMQNPALGAVLIWRFACSYAPQNEVHDGVPLPLAFIVLPIILHERTREKISSTYKSSGMRKFEEKFNGQGDVLVSLSQRVIAMRSLSLRSVRHALASGLLTLISEQGVLWPRSYSKPPVESDAKSVLELLKAAEKLGTWCGSLSVYEISGILRVEL